MSKAIQNLIIKYKQDEIIQMLEILIDNIFVLLGGRRFQQTIGIQMGTNGAPLLADLYLHTYETGFLQGLLKHKDRKLDI